MNIDRIIALFSLLITIIVAYIFYKGSLKVKKPYWVIESNNLIKDFSDQVDDLKILYKREKIKNLTISKVLFLNKGKDTIDRHDIETSNPLNIRPSDGVKILNAQILSSSNYSNQFSIAISDEDNIALLDFDYLDFEQGALLQIIHTGTSSTDIQLVGDIKGVKKIYKGEDTFSFLSGKFLIGCLSFLMIIIPTILNNSNFSKYSSPLFIHINEILQIIGNIGLVTILLLLALSKPYNKSVIESFMKKQSSRL